MIFNETKLKGVYVIEIEPKEDKRGFFARTWCREEFKKMGLHTDFVQCNVSLSLKKGTIRGLHYQIHPYEEVKLVSCIRGSIFDVVVDLRPDSKTYKEWFSTKLTEDNGKIIYVPKGCAHGIQTLEDNTKIFYQVSQYYHPESERGIRFDDPTFNIKWPYTENITISDKDKNLKDFEE